MKGKYDIIIKENIGIECIQLISHWIDSLRYKIGKNKYQIHSNQEINQKNL